MCQDIFKLQEEEIWTILCKRTSKLHEHKTKQSIWSILNFHKKGTICALILFLWFFLWFFENSLLYDHQFVYHHKPMSHHQISNSFYFYSNSNQFNQSKSVCAILTFQFNLFNCKYPPIFIILICISFEYRKFNFIC